MRDQSETLPDWLAVSRETQQDLQTLSARVLQWNLAVNLVSKASAAQIWTRHVLDSAQIFLMAPPDARRWVDLGAGGGFPGLVVAILARETRPDLEVVLVESDQRKAVFLHEAARTLGLQAQVLADRIEDIAPLGADVVSARALAPLSALCGFAHRHMAAEGLALFLKGARVADEIARARSDWHFDLTQVASKTDPESVVLALREIRHV